MEFEKIANLKSLLTAKCPFVRLVAKTILESKLEIPRLEIVRLKNKGFHRFYSNLGHPYYFSVSVNTTGSFVMDQNCLFEVTGPYEGEFFHLHTNSNEMFLSFMKLHLELITKEMIAEFNRTGIWPLK